MPSTTGPVKRSCLGSASSPRPGRSGGVSPLSSLSMRCDGTEDRGSRPPLAWIRQIIVSQIPERFDLPHHPNVVSPQLDGEQRRHPRGHRDRGARVKDKGARPTR